MKQKKHGNQLQIDKEQILAFPIRSIDFSAPDEKMKFDDLLSLTNKMIIAYKNLHDTPLYETDKAIELRNEIVSKDSKIDNMIYELYGLSDNEKSLINSSVSVTY